MTTYYLFDRDHALIETIEASDIDAAAAQARRRNEVGPTNYNPNGFDPGYVVGNADELRASTTQVTL